MKSIKYIFLFLLSYQMYPQYEDQIKLDSLVSLLKHGELNPEGKIKLYEQLFYNNFFKDESKAVRYNKILFTISKKYNLKSGVGDYFLNIAFLKYSKSDFKLALFYSKKAGEFYLKDKNYNDFLFSISRQCMYLKAIGQIDESFKLAINKIKIFKKYTEFAGLGELYQFVAEYYFYNKNYNKSIGYAKRALLIFQKSKYYNGIAGCNILIGDIHYALANYSESIKYIDGINELPDRLKNNLSYQIVYNFLMAKNHIKINNNLKSIHFSNKAISLLQNSDFGLVMIEAKLYKADALQKLGKNEKALNIILNLEKDIQNYLADPDVDESLKYINVIKSNIYKDFKQYKLALFSQQKNLKFKKVDLETYDNVSKLHYRLEQYKDAYENQRIFHNKKLKQLKENQKNNLDELNVLYKVKENEFKIQNFKIQNLINDLEIKKQREYLKNIIIIAVILLLLLLFGIYIYRIRIKVSQILKDKNQKLENANELLNTSLREKEILLKEIHHRVKNNLQLVSSILNIQANDSPDISVAEFLDKCQNRISSIALIHKNLYITENIDKVDFQEYVEDLANCILDSFVNKERISYQIKANENKFNIQTSISLGLIISELSCNSVKHAFKDNEEGRIYVELNKLEDNKFELIFGDNGCGNSNKVETSTSIGLELVSLLAMQLNGNVVELDKQGTFYRITFEEIKN